MTNPKVVCFGEILWDVLPATKLAGGAPMNVAFHLNNFDCPATILSRVGKDAPGEELIAFLEAHNVPVNLLQRDDFYPTGQVKVQLKEDGSATYDILRSVSWDYIIPNLASQVAIRSAEAVVFGSLACRSNRSQETLLSLLEEAKLKIFDVNLRAPFYTRELLETLLNKADIVKMNEEELDLISSWYNLQGIDFRKSLALKAKFNLKIIIITKGQEGAFLAGTQDRIVKVSAKPVVIKDTIGAGDSFLAGFIAQFLKGKSLGYCLDFAARTGALVATHSGGTPVINEKMVLTL